MPNRFGQLTIQDWNNMAAGFRDIAAMADSRNKLKETRGRNKATGYFLKNQDAVPGEVATPKKPLAGANEYRLNDYSVAMNTPGPVPSSRSIEAGVADLPIEQQAAGKKEAMATAQKMRVDEYGDEAKDRHTYELIKESEQLLPAIWEHWENNKNLDPDKMSPALTSQGEAFHLGLKRAAKMAMDTEEVQLALEKTLDENAKWHYDNVFAPRISDSQEKIKQNDAKAMQSVADNLNYITTHIPHFFYEIGRDVDKDNTVSLHYNTPGVDGAEDTGRRIPIEDALKMAASLMGPKEGVVDPDTGQLAQYGRFKSFLKLSSMAAAETNMLAKTYRMKDPNGEEVVVTGMANQYNPKMSKILVTGIAGQKNADKREVYDMMADVEAAGYRRIPGAEEQAAILKNQETLANINKTQAETEEIEQGNVVEQLEQLGNAIGIDIDSLFGQGLARILELANPQAPEGQPLTPEQEKQKQYALRFLELLQSVSGMEESPEPDVDATASTVLDNLKNDILQNSQYLRDGSPTMKKKKKPLGGGAPPAPKQPVTVGAVGGGVNPLSEAMKWLKRNANNTNLPLARR